MMECDEEPTNRKSGENRNIGIDEFIISLYIFKEEIYIYIYFSDGQGGTRRI